MRRRHFDPAVTAMISRYGTPPFHFAESLPAVVLPMVAVLTGTVQSVLSRDRQLPSPDVT